MALPIRSPRSRIPSHLSATGEFSTVACKPEAEKLKKREKGIMARVGDIRQFAGNQNSLEIDGLVRFAVNEQNKKQNSLLELGKVVNVKQQVVSGIMYYITLEAADGGAKKVYDAKIWVKPWMNFKSLQEFKLIGDVPAEASA